MSISMTSYDAEGKIDFLDITAPEAVQVQIRDDGKVFWVNVDGVCRLRICQIGRLEVEDNRSVDHTDDTE